MAKVTDPRDLLVHELGVVYAAEKLIEAALPKMAGGGRRRQRHRKWI